MSQKTLESAGRPADAPVGGPRAVKRSIWTRGWAVRAATPTGFLLIFVVMEFWLDRGFFVAIPRVLNIHQNVPVLLLATAAVIGLLGGAFDLSIAGNATLATFLVVGLTAVQELPFAVVLLAVLGVGALVGLVNGLIVTNLGVNVIIATLGTGSVLLGASSIYSDGAVLSTAGGQPLPEWFLKFGAFTTKLPPAAQVVLVVAAAVWAWYAMSRVTPPKPLRRAWPAYRAAIVLVGGAALFIALDLRGWLAAMSMLSGVYLLTVFLVWVLMDRTTCGRSIKATGANPIAARLAGVRTNRETYRAFVASGLLSAVAGIAIAANQGSASPDVAGGFLLPAFAAAFLSTVIFSSGRFTVPGTAIGGIFIVWVAQGLIEGGLKFTWTDVVNGAVLIGAVSLSTLLRRRAG